MITVGVLMWPSIMSFSPSSPPPVRKASMPSPTTSRKKNVSTAKTSGEGGGRLPLFELIKNSLRLHRSRNSAGEPCKYHLC